MLKIIGIKPRKNEFLSTTVILKDKDEIIYRQLDTSNIFSYKGKKYKVKLEVIVW